MTRKSIRFFRGKSINGQVHLFIEKGFPLFQNNEEVLNFRIYRKKEQDFIQGCDYQEYFDNLDYQDAELIYDGPLAKNGNYYFRYIDKTVKALKVYAYWIAFERDVLPVGPVGIAVRDPHVWWTFEKTNNTMETLKDNYAGLAELVHVGYSTRKRELKALLLGNKSNCIGLIGVVHAGESGPELFLRAAEKIVHSHPELLAEVGLAIMPTVNADSREDMATGTPQYLRCNPNGVDLNRNFHANWAEIDYTYGLDTSVHGSITYRGPFPHSEDETKAAISFIDYAKPKVIFCGHCLSSVCSDYFLTSKEAKGNDSFEQLCGKLLKPYTNGFRNVEKQPVSLRYGCTAGSLPTYVYQKYGIPAFDMEFRAVKDEQRERECVYGRTTVELLDEFCVYHYRGILNLMKSLACPRTSAGGPKTLGH